MNKVVFFIDGFNLYHSIDENPRLHQYKWLNLKRLASLFLSKHDTLVEINYFTALATWSPDKVKRHQTYIKALESEGINIVYGEFRRRTKTCPVCHRQYNTYEEKQTDVNIAIHLFRAAIQDTYDKAFILSGDSDLIPSIHAVKKIFPNKSLGVIIPVGRRAELLKHTCDFHMKLKEKHLAASTFPDEIRHGQQIISRPSSWK